MSNIDTDPLRFAAIGAGVVLGIIAVLVFDGLLVLISLGGIVYCVKFGMEAVDRLDASNKKVRQERDEVHKAREAKYTLQQLKEEKAKKEQEEIEKYGHEKAVEVFKLFNKLESLQEPIERINALFRELEIDDDVGGGRTTPIEAIHTRAKALNADFSTTAARAKREYESFCDFGTRSIAEESNGIDPKIYISVVKRLERELIKAISIEKENKELSAHIEKMEKKN